jgi:hypothetical protein
MRNWVAVIVLLIGYAAFLALAFVVTMVLRVLFQHTPARWYDMFRRSERDLRRRQGL